MPNVLKTILKIPLWGRDRSGITREAAGGAEQAGLKPAGRGASQQGI